VVSTSEFFVCCVFSRGQFLEERFLKERLCMHAAAIAVFAGYALAASPKA